MKDFIDRILFPFCLRWYPRIHARRCDDDQEIYLPGKDAEDNEAFMTCHTCHVMYHLAFVTHDEELPDETMERDKQEDGA